MLYNCYALPIAADCALFQRTANDQYQVSSLFMGEENQGFMRASGCDVNLSYALPKFSFGSDSAYSYNASYDYGRFVYLRYAQKF